MLPMKSKGSVSACCLILAYVLRTKLIGPGPEIPAEVLNTVQICADGRIGEVAATQLLKLS